MKAPIFLDYNGDVIVFASAEEAAQYVEPIDVENSEFVAYDSEGRLLSATCTANQVRLSPTEDEPLHGAQLEASLRSFLNTIGDPLGSDPRCNLSCLVEACRKFTFGAKE